MRKCEPRRFCPLRLERLLGKRRGDDRAILDVVPGGEERVVLVCAWKRYSCLFFSKAAITASMTALRNPERSKARTP